MNTEKPSQITYLLLAGTILVVGTWLRFWGIWRIQIFGDEIHTLRVVSEKSLGWILTNFFHNDACIPYTFYNKLIADTIGLDEVLLRLPEMAAGTLLLAVVLRLGAKVVGPWPALLTTGFLAFSPLFVAMARDARPYSMAMLLITTAGLVAADKDNACRVGALCAAATLLALAVYFLPLVFPAAAVLWLLPPVMGVASGRRDWVRPYAVACGVGLVVGLVTLGPALPSFHEGITSKTALGEADLETAMHGLLLLHGLPILIPLWGWLALLTAGWALAVRRFGLPAALVLAAVVVQLAVIHMSRPQRFEIPWVWLRYWLHMVPLLLLFVVGGYASLLEGYKRRIAVGGLCFLLLLGYGGFQLRFDTYAVSRHAVQPVHPMALLLQFDSRVREHGPSASFYTNFFEAQPSDVLLIVSPTIVVFPLHGLYAPQHLRAVLTAGMDQGLAQQLMTGYPGFRFQTVWREREHASGEPARAAPAYWIHHYNLERELGAWLDLMRENPLAWAQIRRFTYLLEGRAIPFFFGPQNSLREFAPAGWHLVHQDEYVRVFRPESISSGVQD